MLSRKICEQCDIGVPLKFWLCEMKRDNILMIEGCEECKPPMCCPFILEHLMEVQKCVDGEMSFICI